MDYLDQTGYKITLKGQPLKVISLVPSQTELLYYLDIKPVGNTVFCYHPEDEFENSYKIGGTKKLQLDKIRALKPDLIIGNKEENQQEQIETLRREFPVWLSDIYTLEDAIDMIKQIGILVNKQNLAQHLCNQINSGFDSLVPKTNEAVLYLMWKDPYMAAGRNTFINHILDRAGYSNILEDEESRYPKITATQIVELNPSTILLSSEPFPFKEKHIAQIQDLLPRCKVKLVNGELYSWYGPRLLKTIESLR